MDDNIRLLQGEKKIIDAKPDNSIIWYWLFTIGLRYIIAVFFAIFVVSVLVPPQKQLMYQLSIVLITVIIFFAWAALNRFYHYYLFTNLRIISQTGIINKQKKVVSYQRIADIYVAQNWLQRVFGLASIVLEDFSGNRPLVLIGIEKSLADRITHTVSSHMHNQE